MAGTLWYQEGRAYLAPMGIDYAEIDGATIERAWVGLPYNENSYDDFCITPEKLISAMTNDFVTAMRPSWHFVSDCLVNRVCDAFNLGGIVPFFATNGVLMWITGTNATATGMINADPLYTRGDKGVTLNKWSPVVDTADQFPRLDMSSTNNNIIFPEGAPHPVDVSSLGNTNQLGLLSGFPWQKRKWRVPSTNELYVMRNVLTNLHDIAFFGMVPKTSVVATFHEDQYFGSVEHDIEDHHVPDQEELTQLARQAWEGMTLCAQTNGTFFPQWQPFTCVEMDGEAFCFAFSNEYVIAHASLDVWRIEYQNVDFEWPVTMCFTTNIVKNARVCTLPVFYPGGVTLETSGSDDPTAILWDKNNTACVATPNLFIEAIITNDFFDAKYCTYDLAIGSAKLKEVGRVGTPFDMPTTYTKPSFDSLLWDHRVNGYVRKDSTRRSSFFFVILPETDFQYLVD